MTDLIPPGIVLIFVLSSNLILGNFSIVPLEHGYSHLQCLLALVDIQIKNCLLSLMILSFIPCYQSAWSQSSPELSEVLPGCAHSQFQNHYRKFHVLC